MITFMSFHNRLQVTEETEQKLKCGYFLTFQYSENMGIHLRAHECINPHR